MSIFTIVVHVIALKRILIDFWWIQSLAQNCSTWSQIVPVLCWSFSMRKWVSDRRWLICWLKKTRRSIWQCRYLSKYDNEGRWSTLKKNNSCAAIKFHLLNWKCIPAVCRGKAKIVSRHVAVEQTLSIQLSRVPVPSSLGLSLCLSICLYLSLSLCLSRILLGPTRFKPTPFNPIAKCNLILGRILDESFNHTWHI